GCDDVILARGTVLDYVDNRVPDDYLFRYVPGKPFFDVLRFQGSNDVRIVEAYQNRLILRLQGYQSQSGREPWISDGTQQGTYMLADANPGAGDSGTNENLGVTLRGKCYFSWVTPNEGAELWVTDGTPEG